MKIRNHFTSPALLAAISLGLTACSGGHIGSGEDLRTANHSVKELYDNAELRGKVQEACSANTEAQVDLNAKMPGCQAAFEAEKLRMLGRKPE